MKKRLLWVVVFVSVLVLSTGVFAACSSSEAEEEKVTTIEVTDMIGRTVTLDGIPGKIVSLAPSNTEILYSLDLGDKIVVVSYFCNYPAAALEKPKVGGFSTADVEKIVATEPDVIFVSNMHVNEILPALEQLNQTVVVIDPRNLDQVLDSFTLIGKVTGTSTKASQIVKDLSERIEKITDKTTGLSAANRPRVFYVMWHDPLMTVGHDTRIHELIEKAGGTNIFADTEGYPTIELESLVEANPQVIIAGTGMGEGADAPFTFAKTESRLANSEARKTDMIYEINTDLVGRPTERMIDGFEQMAKIIHPDLFD
ncbi:MAG: cobalamin-binding protein [Dehalococcoidales bacterium]|nr:MAG: cobalamin-binding protein [Dehalococcoidales bacterium]